MEKLQGLYVGTIAFPPQAQQPPEQISFNFGLDGLVTVGTRMEAPLINPTVPELGEDIEGVGQGRYECRDDGKIEMVAVLYRQGNIPEVLGIDIPSSPNYCMVLQCVLDLDCYGRTLNGPLKIGFADLSFTGQSGSIIAQIPVTASLTKQTVRQISNLF
jgi:hypothetical protein